MEASPMTTDAIYRAYLAWASYNGLPATVTEDGLAQMFAELEELCAEYGLDTATE